MSMGFNHHRFQEVPLIGILRGFAMHQIEPLISAAVHGGLQNLEITMNSPDAAGLIRLAVECAKGALNIGAGTVTSRCLLDEALGAGASFIVTPTLTVDVLDQCVRLRTPVFPGALSPTEIACAWDHGATMVKIFPAELYGPAYIRAIKAPLPRIKLLPTGGVDLKTLPEFMRAGADGAGIGNPLFDRKRIEADDWHWVESQCRAFAEAWRVAVASR